MNKNLLLTLIMNSIFLKTTIGMETEYQTINLNSEYEFLSLVRNKHKGQNLPNIKESPSSLTTNIASYCLTKDSSIAIEQENILAHRAILTLLCGLPNQSTTNNNLSLIIGPMFAGKTTNLIELIE